MRGKLVLLAVGLCLVAVGAWQIFGQRRDSDAPAVSPAAASAEPTASVKPAEPAALQHVVFSREMFDALTDNMSLAEFKRVVNFDACVTNATSIPGGDIHNNFDENQVAVCIDNDGRTFVAMFRGGQDSYSLAEKSAYGLDSGELEAATLVSNQHNQGFQDVDGSRYSYADVARSAGASLFLRMVGNDLLEASTVGKVAVCVAGLFDNPSYGVRERERMCLTDLVNGQISALPATDRIAPSSSSMVAGYWITLSGDARRSSVQRFFRGERLQSLARVLRKPTSDEGDTPLSALSDRDISKEVVETVSACITNEAPTVRPTLTVYDLLNKCYEAYVQAGPARAQ
ncbi:MAG: hypothetical protein IV086_02500 [Hyphomonadaceae bacterium]|nr:hypothetical protein [Hyphomonadaceae bacterium]